MQWARAFSGTFYAFFKISFLFLISEFLWSPCINLTIKYSFAKFKSPWVCQNLDKLKKFGKGFAKNLIKEACLKYIFCNNSLEFLKVTFWGWNLIFASEKNSRFTFVNTFCRDFSFRKLVDSKKISIKDVNCIL